MTLLRQAARADRGLLQHFICADPEKAQHTGGRHTYHPAPWELTVQDHVRALLVPYADESHAVLIAEDANGAIGGVCDYGFDDTGESVIIFAIGIRQDLKSAGLGREMLEEIIASLVDEDVEVLARIDKRNEPSKRLFSSCGFAIEAVVDDLEIWVRSA